MRHAAHLRNVYKLTNLKHPKRNRIRWPLMAVDELRNTQTQKRSFASKTSGSGFNGDLFCQEPHSRQVDDVLKKLKDENRESSTKNTLDEIPSGTTYTPPENKIPVNSEAECNHTSTPTNNDFNIEMKNFEETLLSPNNFLTKEHPSESHLSLSTNTRLDPFDTTIIPLHFNTLISTSSDVESNKMPAAIIPEFNESLMSLAANICSAALQSGVANSVFRKCYFTESTTPDGNSFQKLALSTSSIVAGKETKDKINSGDGKGCKSSGKETMECQESKDVPNRLGLLDPQLYKKSIKEAEHRRRELARALGKHFSERVCQPRSSGNIIKYTSNSSRSLDSFQCDKNLESAIKDEQEERSHLSQRKTQTPLKDSGSSNQRVGQSKQSTTEPQISSKATASKCSELLHSEKKSKPDIKDVKGEFKSKDRSASSKNQEKLPVCGSEKAQPKNPCEALPTFKQNQKHKTKSQSGTAPTTSTCGSFQSSEFNDSPKTTQKAAIRSECETEPPRKQECAITKDQTIVKPKLKSCEMSERSIESSKCAPKSEQKIKTTLKCSSKSELRVEEPCKVLSEKPAATESSKCASQAEQGSKISLKCTSKTSQLKPKQPCKVLCKKPAKDSSKCTPKSGHKSETSLKCISKSQLKPEADESSKCTSKLSSKAEEPCKDRTKSCGSSQKSDDPCKVPSMTLIKKPTISSSASKGVMESKAKSELKKDEKLSLSESLPALKCTSPSKPKCSTVPEKSKCSPKVEGSKDACKNPSETKSSPRSSCVKPSKKSSDDDAEKACKRVAMNAKQSIDSSPKSLCKSSCDSMAKPKSKCHGVLRGACSSKCRKASKCRSKKASPCASKEKKESKCGSTTKKPEDKPKTSPCESTEKKESKCESATKKTEDPPKSSPCASKEKKEVTKKPPEDPPIPCASKTCAPSPKTSATAIKPSTLPPKRDLHTISHLSWPNLIFRRNFSDKCPEKPEGGYKLETERSDEYRRETCENFSWKTTKPTRTRISEPKNCYPGETLEFCPDTACYKVYAETSGKADRKKGKKYPKGKFNQKLEDFSDNDSHLSKEANKIDTNEALCTKRMLSNSFGHHKRHFSTHPIVIEEALIQKPHSVCTRRLTLPEISDNDALICVESVALSDTDIHIFETGARHTPELSLGHEAAGVVIEVGRDICNLKPGDHVVLESGLPCLKCDLCKIGRYNICNSLTFQGFLKNQSIHPASFCHKICSPIPLNQAALIPQLALGCNACYQAGIKPNSNVAIIGSCAKTVCAAMCAISMGAGNVCVMCGMPETRILIEQFVTNKVNSFESTTVENGIVRMILALLGTPPDIIINCAATTKTMNASIMVLKPAGICTIAGFLSECVSFNVMEALMKEIQIRPSFRSKNMFPKAINLLESGRAPLDCLVANCDVCKWNELETAFKLALSEANNGPRKAIVSCQITD